MKASLFAKLGAVAYVIWGVLHLKAAQMMVLLGQSIAAGALQGRIYQHAWNLLFFAVFAIAVAVWMNWKNSRLGYWLNLVVISAADIGFVVFVLMPGHVPMMPGVLGPIFWIVALLLTTLGVMRSNRGDLAA